MTRGHLHHRRWGVAAALIVASSLLFAQACDRGKQAKQPSPRPTEPTQRGADQGASAEEATDHKHGGAAEAVPEREVKDVGPPAPTVLMLSGLKGYTEPCGCTLDIKAGGIGRIAGYLEAVSAMAPGALVLDAGDIWFEEPEIGENRVEQERLKARAIARAYAEIKVPVTVPGPNDFALGVELYDELIETAGLEPLGANMRIGERALPGSKVFEVAGMKIGVIGAADPARFEGVEGVAVAPAGPAIATAIEEVTGQGAQAVVLLFQGQDPALKALLEAHPRVDFGVAAAKPEETDQVDEVGRARALEVYDQGRYVGVLKLYDPEGRAPEEAYQNARTGSAAEFEKVKRQIEHVNDSLNKLPPAAPGEESPMHIRLRDRLNELEARKRAIENASVDVPEGERAFIWRTVRMDEGFPVDEAVDQIRVELNAKIQEVNASKDFELVEPEPGQAFYVGNAECKKCHAPAYEFWRQSNHGHALETLQERNKALDQNCIGCHVVGYEEPGGSVIGKLEYEATLHDGAYTFKKDLKDVGCENCHGPGSKHVEAAMFGEGKPDDHIINEAIDATTCTGSCHVPEHSPRFNWETYRPEILGPGHGEPVE